MDEYEPEIYSYRAPQAWSETTKAFMELRASLVRDPNVFSEQVGPAVVYVTIFAVPGTDKGASKVLRSMKLDSSKWTVVSIEPSVFNLGSPGSNDVTFRVKGVPKDEVPIRSVFTPWRNVFNPSLMRNAKMIFSHALSAYDLMRILVLAHGLKMDPSARDAIDWDWRRAVVQEQQIVEWFKSPDVQKGLQEVLTERGWRVMVEEMKHAGWSESTEVLGIGRLDEFSQPPQQPESASLKRAFDDESLQNPEDVGDEEDENPEDVGDSGEPDVKRGRLEGAEDDGQGAETTEWAEPK